MDTYFDLGSHTRAVTTTSAEAQTWFDRGLNWVYAFHRDEAVRCFEKVIELDPHCAMGHWGLAMATGPYYNGPWFKIPPLQRDIVVKTSFGHAQEALQLAGAASGVEQALITALATRVPEEACSDQDTFDSWDTAYADAMRDVLSRFPDDVDVQALTIEALICRTPWQLWDLEDRVPAKGADTEEALGILERALAQIEQNGGRPHPGLLHFHVHIMEMSPTPEAALQSAAVLGGIMPDSAHLIHMPSHIYVLCGEYEKALQVNVDAVVADDKYVALHGEPGVYTIYMLHNIHFQIYAAMFLGQHDHAMQAADAICEIVTPEVLANENPFLVNYFEGFYGMKVHALIRFGKWQEIIDAPLPEDPDVYLVTTALWHYAKGVAYSATGDVQNAEAQQKLFAEAFERVPEERLIFNNQCRDMLKVGEAMLSGELEYRKQNYEAAFAELERCVDLYDHLNYSEPWVWMQPPRHALGALLLEQDRVEEAASVYRADLGIDDTLVRPSQHHGNVWALHGYLECCEKLGRVEEAAEVAAQLTAVQSKVDVDVTSSCFCRQADDAGPCC